MPCDRVALRDFGNNFFGSSGILKDKVIERMASVGPILSLIELERIVGPQWPWFGKYGDELLTALLGMSIVPMIPKPTQQKAAKRPSEDEAASQQDIEEDVPAARNNKRPRTGITTMTHRGKAPTAVRSAPVPGQPSTKVSTPLGLQPPSVNSVQPPRPSPQQFTFSPQHPRAPLGFYPPYPPTLPIQQARLPYPYSQLMQPYVYSQSANSALSHPIPLPYHPSYPPYTPPPAQ